MSTRIPPRAPEAGALTPASATLEVIRSWPPEKFVEPEAPPLATGAALGRQMARFLTATQGLYLWDHRAKSMLYVSTGMTRLLGYPPEAFADYAFLYSLIHPDDLPAVTDATVMFNHYAQAHVADDLREMVASVDFRVRHADGHYLRMLRQNTVLEQDEAGAVVAIGCILTDITAHKHTLDVCAHINQHDFPAFLTAYRFRTAHPLLSDRERAVLRLVLDGLTSSQIAHRLGIHPTTVSTHRRNVLRKVRSHSLHDLLRYLNPTPA